MRQVVLDTETTGLAVEKGHRIVEIGCVELRERRPTGQHFHRYLNPQRAMDMGAQNVHGLSEEFLADKPVFADVADDFLGFLGESELIIHNAAFDVGFIDAELGRLGRELPPLRQRNRVTDSLELARERFPGQRNSLDALCKRLQVDNSHRTLHGALLDAQLLAEVYLALTAGQGALFSDLKAVTDEPAGARALVTPLVWGERPAKVLRATAFEREAHAARLIGLRKGGRCLWPEEGLGPRA